MNCHCGRDLRQEIDLMNEHIASKCSPLNEMVSLIEKHGFVIRAPEQVFDAIESRLNEQSGILGRIKLSIPFVMINTVKS
jgi:hypothetical protein